MQLAKLTQLVIDQLDECIHIGNDILTSNRQEVAKQIDIGSGIYQCSYIM